MRLVDFEELLLMFLKYCADFGIEAVGNSRKSFESFLYFLYVDLSECRRTLKVREMSDSRLRRISDEGSMGIIDYGHS